MDRSNLFCMMVILGILGVAVTTGHPAWGTITGVAMLLVAGAMAASLFATRSEGRIFERRVANSNQKISNNLVALSSAAILAIYAAGYQRTRSAAEEFELQAARRKMAAPIAATVVVPTEPASQVSATATIPRPLAQSRTDHSRALSTKVPKAPPPTAPVPADDSVATSTVPPVATTASDPLIARAAAQIGTAPQRPFKDGTYLGWGSCRHGDIQASVVIQSGKIVSAEIAQCLTRYSCSWIANLPGQVIGRQNPSVDYVSGATQSSDAYSDAVAAALTKASE